MTEESTQTQTESRPSVKGGEAKQPTSAKVPVTHVRIGKKRSYAKLISIIIIVAAVGFIVDTVSHAGRAYPGVTVAGIDVEGMNVEEIVQKVSAKYEPVLKSKPVRAYASQELLDEQAENIEATETDTVEESLGYTVVWPADAQDLDASIDYTTAAQDAVNMGRSSPIERIGLLIQGKDVPLTIDCNDKLVDEYASEIDAVLGYKYQNCMVVMLDDVPYITEGHDGDMVNRDWLEGQVSELLLKDPEEPRDFVAYTEHQPLQIDYDQAQVCADFIQERIEGGLEFKFGDLSWSVDAQTLGNWVSTEVVEDDDGTQHLEPNVNSNRARNSILVHAIPGLQEGKDKVEITNEGGTVQVSITTDSKLPNVEAALEDMQETLFGEKTPTSRVIEVKQSDAPSKMSFDQAVSNGLIAPISTFTTEYTSNTPARNTNIHLAADLLNNSICKSDGGVWSFNETAGECNEEKGFQAAIAIAGDETVDEIGGGICQVATTVFNAAYEAGFGIEERANHSLYIPTYPAGRDSAVSWEFPDLKWRNDTHSDVILIMSYDDSSVTASIYGVDPGYTVQTETGQWEQGEPSQTVYEFDASLAPGQEYVKMRGADGLKIKITRTVSDKDDNLLFTDVFESHYSASNTIIVRGAE